MVLVSFRLVLLFDGAGQEENEVRGEQIRSGQEDTVELLAETDCGKEIAKADHG